MYGKKSIVERQPFINLTTDQKKELIKKKRETNLVHLEMQRLRENRLIQNKFPFLEPSLNKANDEKNNTSISIMYHNAGVLAEKIKNINSDYGFKSCDILFFGGTHTFAQFKRNDLLPDGFEFHRVTGSKSNEEELFDNMKPHGQVVYVKTLMQNSIQFIANNSNNGAYKGNELSMMSFHKLKIQKNEMFLLNVWNNRKIETFYQIFKTFLREMMYGRTNNEQQLPPLIVFGNFGIDFQKKIAQEILEKIERKFGLEQKIREPTNDENKHTNYLLTNIKERDFFNLQVHVYESYFSEQKPIWFSLDLFL